MSSRTRVIPGLVLISCVGMSLAAKQAIIAATSYTYSKENQFLSVSEYLEYNKNPALCKRGNDLATQASAALTGYSKTLMESKNVKVSYENYLQKLKELYAKLESNQVSWVTSTFQDSFFASSKSNLPILSRANQEIVLLTGIRTPRGFVISNESKPNILYAFKEYLLDIEKFITLTPNPVTNSQELTELAKGIRVAYLKCSGKFLQVQQESRKN